MAKERSHKATKVLERLEQKVNRQIATSLAACVHCGNCSDSCHYVLANPDDPTYQPSYKADKLRKLFKSTAYWNPKVSVGATGKAQVKVTLPDNLTTYRIMAVAADLRGRVGASDSIMWKPCYIWVYCIIIICGIITTRKDIMPWQRQKGIQMPC